MPQSKTSPRSAASYAPLFTPVVAVFRHSTRLKPWDSCFDGACHHRWSYRPSTSVSTLRVPRGEQAQPLISDVEGRIKVAVMPHATVRAHPRTVGLRQAVVLVAAVVAQLGGRVEAVHDDDVGAVPPPFVRQLPAQRAQACVQNALGQLGSRQAPHAQVFDTHRLMVLDQRGGQLVQEVGALVGHTLMHTGHVRTRLRAVAAAFLPTREHTLGASQLALAPTVEAWRGHARAIAARDGVLQAQVQTHSALRPGRGQVYSRRLALGDRCDKPVATGVAREGGALGRTHDGLREAQPHTPDLGYLHAMTNHRDPLRDTKARLVALLALEARIPCSALKEGRDPIYPTAKAVGRLGFFCNRRP